MKTYRCRGCGCQVSAQDFERIDAEFDPKKPHCPDCDQERRLQGQTCEHCDLPAEYEVELGFLCAEHHDHYIDGFLVD